jgi:hypothetical protein
MGNKVRATVVLEVPTDEKDRQIEAEEGLDWAREETIRILRGAGRRRWVHRYSSTTAGFPLT